MASSSPSASHSIIEIPGDGNSDYKRKLQEFIHENEWNNLRDLLENKPEAKTEPITENGETALILVANRGKESNSILKKLLDILSREDLTWRNGRAAEAADRKGNTALHAAAVVGNLDGAKILVECNKNLANISNHAGHLPFHIAVTHVHRDLMLFLLKKTARNVWFKGIPGAKLMCSLISSGFYDVALQLIKTYPMSALNANYSPLVAIAQEHTAFRSGVKLGFWKHVMYTLILLIKKYPVSALYPDFSPLEAIAQEPTAVRNGVELGFWKRVIYTLCRRFFSKVLDIIVPQLKNIRRMKESHLQAMELLRCLCSMKKNNVMCYATPQTSKLIFERSVILAAQYGISEIVEEISKSFPGDDVIKSAVDEDEHSALHLAVMYRHENVFNVLNVLHGNSFGYISTSSDRNGNNILHLAGYRAPHYQLDLVSSAVLQMQRELKWFQEVERLVPPKQKKLKNKEGMTPLEVFQKEHKDMEVYEGQWMTGMANSCTVATTIIGTIAFAAAITVPGGNKGDGFPIFSGGAAFIIFAISNALALFSSICTLLIFLSILTSRYATIDYLYSLPNRLIMGLVALFFSITSMIISFSATLYLVFAQNNNRILIPIVALALLPVTLFVILQFPLLLNMMQSTYGSILRPKKEEKPNNI